MSRLSATDPGRQKNRLTPEMLDVHKDAVIKFFFFFSILVFIALWKTVAADQSGIITLIISASSFYWVY